MEGFRGHEGPRASFSVEEGVPETQEAEKGKGQQNVADK